MENRIEIFTNAEFGEVRTLTGTNGEVLFCGADAAKALGYANTRDALARHCKEKGVVKRDTLTKGGVQALAYIDESNLYRLIAHSKLPSAERFESWVFDEVLPTIRRHGAYMTENTLEKALASPDFLIQLATRLKEEQERRKQLEIQAEQDKPKVIFANAVETSKTSILIGQLAKIIKQNGVDIGQKRLFEWLRNKGYLMKTGSSVNLPTQKAMDLGLFEVKEQTVSNPDGSIRITRTTKVTGKGQTYFVNKFLAAN